MENPGRLFGANAPNCEHSTGRNRSDPLQRKRSALSQEALVSKTLHRQRLQVQLLDLEPSFDLGAAVEGGGDMGHQLPVLGLGGEIPAAALEQLLLQPVFQ